MLLRALSYTTVSLCQRNLYHAWITISKLRKSVRAKRSGLQMLKQNLKVTSIIKGHVRFFIALIICINLLLHVLKGRPLFGNIVFVILVLIVIGFIHVFIIIGVFSNDSITRYAVSLENSP